jgi:hypothetical protein
MPSRDGYWRLAIDWMCAMSGLRGMIRFSVLAASRVIAKTTQDLEICRGLSPSSRLASAPLEVLRGLADRGDVEQLATAAREATMDEPTEWTCRWCGSVESISEWDCTSSSVGHRLTSGRKSTPLPSQTSNRPRSRTPPALMKLTCRRLAFRNGSGSTTRRGSDRPSTLQTTPHRSR